jgi:superfamily II DNA/RNA helicase
MFIVDNTDENWKALNYLNEWCEISKQFDIATGYFEISSLISMDGHWQKLEKIRILMGDEVSPRTKSAFAKALNEKLGQLDESMETAKEGNDFLEGVDAVIKAMRSGKIECRVYKKKKFHAKAYITYDRSPVRPPVALVGSANFTFKGLTDNIELNVQIENGAEVKILQEWYEKHWEEAVDVSEEVLEVIEKHTKEYTPFHVYAKSLQELLRGHEESTTEWERTKSVMFKEISQYQKEAYHACMKIANRWRGAFLCDGVGLGKTFVGLMLLERLVVHDRKNVVLLVPKSGRIAVWEENIKVYLPNLLNNPFVSLHIYNHTDLLRSASKDRNFPAEWEQIKENADAFIIDEGHNFRNHNSGRYKQLQSVLNANKQLFMLTATPINNSLFDLKDQIDLFTGKDEKFFAAAPLGIHNLQAYFIRKERALRVESGEEDAQITDDQAREILNNDELFRELVVQRSRNYVKESIKLENSDRKVMFAEREAPQVANYSLKAVYGDLLDKIEKAFDKKKPLLRLPVYSLYDKDPDTEEFIYFIGNPDDDPDFAMKSGRQVQVVALIRVLLLKRLESSVVSFRETCENLILKLYSFIEIHDERTATRWRNQHEDLFNEILAAKGVDFDDWDEDDDEDIMPEDLKFDWKPLDEDLFDVTAIVMDTVLDLDQLIEFMEEIEDFDPKKDDKVNKLIDLINTDEDLKKEKLIIFTEFQATAKYLEKSLKDAGFKQVFKIDSTTETDRGLVMKRFSPYYNKTTPQQLKADGHEEIKILIATDVLSEGVNLQDARLLLNYDLHWNPVRLMQRIGRVDRRMDPDLEELIIKDNPLLISKRGKARFWNFLPPDELNNILSLYQRVTHKTLRISKVFGIEGRQLLTEQDDYDALEDFNHTYQGDITRLEEMHLLYQEMLKKDAGLYDQLENMPKRLFSGKEKIHEGSKGVFFCYKLPTLIRKDEEAHEYWSVDEGFTQWILFNLETEEIFIDSSAIDPLIRSEKDTKRVVQMDKKDLSDIKNKVEHHIHETYIRKNQVPAVDKDEKPLRPQLITWMELN